MMPIASSPASNLEKMPTPKGSSLAGALLRIGLSLISAQLTGLLLSLLLSWSSQPFIIFVPMTGYGQIYAFCIWACGGWIVAGAIPISTQLYRKRIVFIASALQASMVVSVGFWIFYGWTVHTDNSQLNWLTVVFLLCLVGACQAGTWVYLKMLEKLTKWREENAASHGDDSSPSAPSPRPNRF